MACDRSSWTAEDPYFIEIQKATVCPDRTPTFRRCRCDPPRYKTPSSLYTPDNFPTPLRRYSGDFQCKSQRSKSVPVKLEPLGPIGGPFDVGSSRARSAAADKKSKTSPKGRKNARIGKIVEEKESGANQKADKSTQKAEDFKYTEFLLNITTDIIKNNLNTEKEYDVIFKYHIDANKDKLNERRMLEEIEKLKLKLRNENDVIFDENDELPGFENMPECCRVKQPEPIEPMETVDNKDILISGKVAFKLAMDENEEPTVLIEGPMLLPKSVVENNMTTIILQNSYPVSFQGKL